MDPEELDSIAFDSAMSAAALFFRHHGAFVDRDAQHSIVSVILAAFMAAGGITEENAVRWREGLRVTHKPTH